MDQDDPRLSPLQERQDFLWLSGIMSYGVLDTVMSIFGIVFTAAEEIGPLARVLIQEVGLIGLPLMKFSFCMLSFLVWDRLQTPSRLGIPLGINLVGFPVVIWNFGILITVLT